MHMTHKGRGALDCGALLCGLEDDFSGVPLNLFAGEPPAEKAAADCPGGQSSRSEKQDHISVQSSASIPSYVYTCPSGGV